MRNIVKNTLDLIMNPSSVLVCWILLLVGTYFLFLPIKGDKFSHFPPLYLFLLTSTGLIWFTYFLVGKKLKSATFLLTLAAVTFSLLFPVCSYFYNGRLYYIQNAAEFGYTRVLWLLLDESSADEIDLAITAAKQGENAELVKILSEKKHTHK